MASKLRLDDDQMFALMKFKQNVKDIIQPHHNERFLCRWLRARSWDVEAAEKMYRNSMDWRKQWEVDDTLKNWNPPEPLASCYCSGVAGFDKEGHPVYVVPIGNLDIVGLIHSTSKQDLIRITIKLLEETLALAQRNGRTEVVAIFDLENLNIKKFVWKPAVELIVTILQMYSANYPEILKICFIVNAPRLFSMSYNLLKKVIDPYTQSKIKIFNNDTKKWQSALLEYINPDNLPKFYGGTMVDLDGDPKCPSKIRPGAKIPKKYYRKNLSNELDMKRYVTATVKKGKKLVLEYLIVDDNCFLEYNFRTEGHDIKFGISYTDEDGNVHPVIRHGRTAANVIDVTGTIACKAPATYTVTFDNSYSVFRSKVLHYLIWIREPENKDIDEAAEDALETIENDIENTKVNWN